MELYAHSLPDRPMEEWQPLDQHLRNVAELAAKLAEPFGGAEWARLAGLWHDVGKASDTFQTYLKRVNSKDPKVAASAISTDHSTAGAQHLAQNKNMLGLLLSYVIAGHHGGLPNGLAVEKSLQKRLQKKVEPWLHDLSLLDIPADLKVPEPCPLLKNSLAAPDAFSLSFFVRMLFSVLTDADFLDTEAFIDSSRHGLRGGYDQTVLKQLEFALDRYVKLFGEPQTEVDRQRAAVRESCLQAASLSPGFFSLTVPTGGGKTLASLAFAVRHALLHHKRRIVYVIPFTSIIDQTASIFKSIIARIDPALAESAVVEHHSNFDPDRETERSRLATENWDAPLIVTTAVQFYESLFGSRSSTCRKLHNLADSVIILDEAQCLPVDLLTPCLAALHELVDSYGVSVVLCTATQPAIRRREGFQMGIDNVREIIPDPVALYRSLERTQIENLGQVADRELVEQLAGLPQVLCIVNTRRHAAELFRQLAQACDDSTVFHLSASMCGVHRQQVLANVVEKLKSGMPCRLISTQVVEAGVDIDFPAVFRSMAGIDSIAQAAGRCNRNGLRKHGRVAIFQSEHRRAEKFFADTANCGRQVLEIYPNPLEMAAVEHYFRLYYWDQRMRWDAREVMDCFQLDRRSREFPFLFDFAEASHRFRLIQDRQESVVVPYGEEGRRLCEQLRHADGFGRNLLRRLQRYAVQVPRRVWRQHVGNGIELLHERFSVLVSPEMNYCEKTGLDMEATGPACMDV